MNSFSIKNTLDVYYVSFYALLVEIGLCCAKQKHDIEYAHSLERGLLCNSTKIVKAVLGVVRFLFYTLGAHLLMHQKTQSTKKRMHRRLLFALMVKPL